MSATCECGLEIDKIAEMGEDAHRDYHRMQSHFAPEELDPELAAYLRVSASGWTNIQHPLVQSIMHVPPLNKSVNATLRAKREALDRAFEEEDWNSYIFLHERPWRVDALLEIMDFIPDEKYWDVVAGIWLDTENLWQWGPAIEEILTADRPERESFMDDEQREALAAMPDQIEIWRGYQHPDSMLGWSWTIDKARAEWFSKRYEALPHLPPPNVAHGIVNKTDVIAYFTDRNESEIVVNPADVKLT